MRNLLLLLVYIPFIGISQTTDYELEFNSATLDYVEMLNTSAVIANKTSFSISGWVNPQSNTNHGGIMGFRNNIDADFYLLQLQNTNNIEARFRNSLGVDYDIVAFNALDFNQWQHLAFTYNGSYIRLYKDGIFLDSTAANGTIAGGDGTRNQHRVSAWRRCDHRVDLRMAWRRPVRDPGHIPERLSRGARICAIYGRGIPIDQPSGRRVVPLVRPSASFWREVQLSERIPVEGALRRRIPRRAILHNMHRDPGSFLGFGIVAGVILVAALAPLLPLHDPTHLDLQNRLLSPSFEFPLGTDHLGRDELSRLIFGARTTLLMSAASLAIIMTLASTVGSLSGYYGGWLDTVLMMVVDLMLAFPSLILGVAVAGILGPSLINVMIAVSVV